MKDGKLIHTEHYMYSVVEVYLSKDKLKVHQIKCLTRNRCRKYTFDTQYYLDNEMIGYKLIENKLNNI